MSDCISTREAKLSDLTALVALEESCFSHDRISRRSFRHFVQDDRSVVLVALDAEETPQGYGVVWCHQGTRLARLYSLAVSSAARGKGIAVTLLQALERCAIDRERLFMRLEVSASNQAAIALYERAGYKIFGAYSDYYDDHSDALRMQKCIRAVETASLPRATPWYAQTTEFTCGPASLMMAMASLRPEMDCTPSQELDIWREATTIFMTSGHGGCHPLGLALAAKQRQFHASVVLNTDQPLFLEGVRSEDKKRVMTLVHEQFVEQCLEAHVDLVYEELSIAHIEEALHQGRAVLVLISTYQMAGKKAPHWVVVTTMDELCLYLHDPDIDEASQMPIDCQHVPIARADFERMASYGGNRLKAAVFIG